MLNRFNLKVGFMPPKMRFRGLGLGFSGACVPSVALDALQHSVQTMCMEVPCPCAELCDGGDRHLSSSGGSVVAPGVGQLADVEEVWKSPWHGSGEFLLQGPGGVLQPVFACLLAVCWCSW